MVVIAFSGGCFSGKTTALNILKHELMCEGIEVHTGNELVRGYIEAADIDSLRDDPCKYLSFEIDVISRKMQYESSLHSKFSNDCVVLLDRALTDSLMYFTQYIDISGLGDKELRMYRDFREKLSDCIYYSFAHVYTHLVEFTPLKRCATTIGDTMYRPMCVDTLKYIEHSLVKDLNECYANRVSALSHNSRLRYIRTDMNGYDNSKKWLSDFLRINNDIL